MATSCSASRGKEGEVDKGKKKQNSFWPLRKINLRELYYLFG
jgi:hypothetical protein